MIINNISNSNLELITVVSLTYLYFPCGKNGFWGLSDSRMRCLFWGDSKEGTPAGGSCSGASAERKQVKISTSTT